LGIIKNSTEEKRDVSLEVLKFSLPKSIKSIYLKIELL